MNITNSYAKKITQFKSGIRDSRYLVGLPKFRWVYWALSSFYWASIELLLSFYLASIMQILVKALLEHSWRVSSHWTKAQAGINTTVVILRPRLTGMENSISCLSPHMRMNWNILPFSTPHCTAVQETLTVVNYIALRYTTLQCSAVHLGTL